MKNDQWRDRVSRELAGERVEPASDDFYRGVWKRIRATAPGSSIESVAPSLYLGRACWKAVPVFAALVLLVCLYSWRFPPNDPAPVADSADSLVLDSDTAPSSQDLLYQIMNNAQFSDPETPR